MTPRLWRNGMGCRTCGKADSRAFTKDGYPNAEFRRITGWKPGDGPVQTCRCKEVSP